MAGIDFNKELVFHSIGKGYLETVTGRLCDIIYGQKIKFDVKATLVDIEGGDSLFPIYTFISKKEGSIEIDSAVFNLAQTGIGQSVTYTTTGTKKNSRILATLSTTSLGTSLTGVSNVKCIAADGTQLTVSAISTPAVAGAKTFTVSTNFVADDTFTVGGVTLTAKASGATGLQFNIGLDASATAGNIRTVLTANTTVNAIYTVSGSTTAITLTETVAGGGHTPADSSTTGTGVVTNGAATTSAAGYAPTGLYVSATGDITWGASVAAGEYIMWFKSDSATATEVGMLKNEMPEVCSFTWMLPSEELDGSKYQVDLYANRVRADGAFSIDTGRGTASVPKMSLRILDPGDGTDDFATIVVSKLA